MSKIITKLSINVLHDEMINLGFEAWISVIEGSDIPCVCTSIAGTNFVVYTFEGQPLCFQSIINRPIAGFTDVSNYWNSNRRFAKVVPFLDGYLIRFEAEVSHGVTAQNLKALINSFSALVSEFSAFAEAPSRPLQ